MNKGFSVYGILLILIFILTALLLCSCRTKDNNNEEFIPVSSTETDDNTFLPEEVITLSPTEKPQSVEPMIIEVHNANELLDNLKSNTHLLLMEGDYSIHDAEKHVEITGITNLTLEGFGDTRIDLSDAYRLYIRFSSCSDIKFKNIEFANTNTFSCYYGAIFCFDDQCKNITIENCRFFGSFGYYKRFAYKTSSLVIKNSHIVSSSCPELLELSFAQDVYIDNCSFESSFKQDITFDDCTNIMITNSTLSGMFVDFPQIYDNGTMLIDFSQDGTDKNIHTLKSDNVMLEGIKILGNELIDYLHSMHADIDVSITPYPRDDLNQGMAPVVLEITYLNGLEKTEYLNQIQKAKKIISERVEFHYDLYLYFYELDSNGQKNQIASLNDMRIFVDADSEDLKKMMNTAQDYITIQEAYDILKPLVPEMISINSEQTISKKILV